MFAKKTYLWQFISRLRHGAVKCYHEKSGDMSSGYMSGLMIITRVIAVEWPNVLVLIVSAIGWILSRYGICFYRLSRPWIHYPMSKWKEELKLENQLDWFGYKINVRKHAPSGGCWNSVNRARRLLYIYIREIYFIFLHIQIIYTYKETYRI